MTYQRFDKDSVLEIIKLALKENNAGTQPPETTLSMQELIDIGKEVGLSEKEVVAAANKYMSTSYTFRSETTPILNIEECSFMSQIPKKDIWTFIQAGLDEQFGESSFIYKKEHVPEYKWKHTDNFDIETVATFRNIDSEYRLRLTQTVGEVHPWADASFLALAPAIIFAFLSHLLFDIEAIQTSLISGALLWGLFTPLVYLGIKYLKRKKGLVLKRTLNNIMNEFLEKNDQESNPNIDRISMPDQSIYHKKGEPTTDSPSKDSMKE